MTANTVEHAGFVIERHFDASPAQVFAAWSDPEAKARWFVGPEENTNSRYEFDFRVGGRERVSGGPPGGPVYEFNGCYMDIVQDCRIIYAYDMHMDGQRISVSLTTVEFVAEGKGTKMTFTERDVFLEGADTIDQRKAGTEDLLDNLEVEVHRAVG